MGAGRLQFNSIKEGDSGIIATAGTIETVVEDPLLPVLEEDPNKTQTTWQIRGPCLDHDPASPRLMFFMKNFIPNFKVGVFLNPGLPVADTLRYFLG